MKRVICLFPGSSELLSGLTAAGGTGFELVGTHHEDRHAPASCPRLTNDKPAEEEDFSALSAAVAEQSMWGAPSSLLPMLRLSLSVYEVDLEALQGMKPDVVLTQVQTTAGGLSVSAADSALHSLVGRPVRVVQLGADPTIAGSLEDIVSVGEALGCREAAVKAAGELRARLGRTAAMALGRPRPRVATLQWVDPCYTAGAWVPELVTMAGGTDVFAPAGFEPSLGPSTELRGAGSEQGPGAPSGSARKSAVPSLEVTAGALAAARPEVVCFAVCGWGLQRAASAVQGLLELPEWEWLRKARVLVFDARRLFSEAGPVLVDTLEALLEAVQPEVQGFGHEGKTFLRIRTSPAS